MEHSTQESLLASVPEIKKIIVDQKIPLKDRFRCIFALKNIGGKEAIDALSDGFRFDVRSYI
jgi:hypothetical protein